MYTIQPKKMLTINILDILKRYTDIDHRLSQKEITEILENEYQTKIERKAVKRNLMNLIDAGINICYSESIRINKAGEEETLYSDFYLERDFDDSELRLLIDSLLFSKHIPHSQCKELIGKLEGLSNRYFKSKVKHIRNLPEDIPVNGELFWTIEVLDKAIGCGRQVRFRYNSFGMDKKLHPRCGEDGVPREYIINPYQMVATNGRYYLICTHERHDELANYRVDRISEIELLETPSKTNRHSGQLDLPKHMAEHIYMFAGPSVKVTFEAEPCIVGEIVDWFGKSVEMEKKGGRVLARIQVNEGAMHYWALQYSPYITVLSPQSLVDSICADLAKALRRYDE